VQTYIQRYSGSVFGAGAAIGMMKVGAILWQTTLSGWSLLHVLALPAALAGLSVGIGAGHDRVVSASVAKRLVPLGGLFLLSVPAAGLFLGADAIAPTWMATVPLGFALMGLPVGHPETSIYVVPSGEQDSVGEHVETG